MCPDRCVAIVGPTAAGKTDLAVALGRALEGRGPSGSEGHALARAWGAAGAEIISADSRQVYARLDAGTAKPRLDNGRCEGIAYHLVGVLDPADRVDAGWYARTAGAILAGVRARGRIPLVTGGTGLYLRSLLEGLDPLPAADLAVRGRLEREAAASGRETLHRRLATLDPAAAARTPAGNVQRVVRALEVHETTGRPISSFWKGRRTPAGTVVLRVERPAAELRERILSRCRAMWPDLLSEVRGLLAAYDGREPGFQSLGYREAVLCARGRLSSEEGLSRLVTATLAYAKRQRTWFRTQISGRSVPGGDVPEMVAAALRRLGE